MNRFILLLVLLCVIMSSPALQAKTPLPTYPVQLIASTGGKITPGRETVKQGAKNVKFKIRPDKGFAIESVSLNETPLGRVAVVTIPLVDGPIAIVATFAPGMPTVDAGHDNMAFAGIPLTLEPTVTPAIPGDSLKYEWRVINKPGSSKVRFSDRRALSPTFVASRPGSHLLQLKVSEGNNTSTATVWIFVEPSPQSNPPVAVAEAPSVMYVSQQITLQGKYSYDPSGLPLSYDWQMLAKPEGSTATLSNATSANSVFTVDLPGVYVAQLTVANQYATSEPQLVQMLALPGNAPIAAAGPDQRVLPRATVTLDGSASSDLDDDPLTYSWSFLSCPQANCPALKNAATAKPSFVAGMQGTYVLNLSVSDGKYDPVADSVEIISSFTPSDPGMFQMKWQSGVFGTYIGEAGLHVTDLDNDGSPEIVASASGAGGKNIDWYILRRISNGSYEQVWRSEIYAFPMVRLLVADVTGDGSKDVIVGLTDGTVTIYDGPTRAVVRQFHTVANLADMAVADLDGDGTAEIVTTDGSGVSVHSAVSGALQWSLSQGGGASLVVGNVDKDSSREIVTTTANGKGYVIDATSRAIEWDVANGFGKRIALGDLDGDDMLEIVGAAAWGTITVFDAEVKSSAWAVPTVYIISALLVADVNGDGKADILYGDGAMGKVHAIDALTRQELWAISHPDWGVDGLAYGDTDKDGTKEVLWGAGGETSAPDHLYIADPLTGSIEWQSMHIDGPLSAVDVGDLDGDGDDEILMVSRYSDSYSGMIHIYDAKTHALEYRDKLAYHDDMWARSVRIGDVDGDGSNEFVVTTGTFYGAELLVYDGASRALKYESDPYPGNYFSALAIADVDNDGKLEIIAGQGRESSISPGTYLIVYDGATLQEKWRSAHLSVPNGVHDIKVADVDGDGHQELIATLGDRLVVYDAITHMVKHLGNQSAISLEVLAGSKEILVGREDGMIDVIDGGTFAVKRTVATTSKSWVVALRAVDLTGDGVPEWLAAHENTLDILDGNTQALTWLGPPRASNLGMASHLVVRDPDGNGRKELFAGDSLGVYHFEQKPLTGTFTVH